MEKTQTKKSLKFSIPIQFTCFGMSHSECILLAACIPDFCAFSFDALQLTESMESYTIPLTLRAKYMNETKQKKDTRKKITDAG